MATLQASQLEKNILLIEAHIGNIRSAFRIAGDLIEAETERRFVLDTLNLALDMAQAELAYATSIR
jgi:hypothetical protein